MCSKDIFLGMKNNAVFYHYLHVSAAMMCVVTLPPFIFWLMAAPSSEQHTESAAGLVRLLSAVFSINLSLLVLVTLLLALIKVNQESSLQFFLFICCFITFFCKFEDKRSTQITRERNAENWTRNRQK